MMLDTGEAMLLHLACVAHAMSLLIAELNGAVEDHNNVININLRLVVTVGSDVGGLAWCISICIEVCLQCANSLVHTATEHDIASFSHLNRLQCLVELLIHDQLERSVKSSTKPITTNTYVVASFQVLREDALDIDHGLDFVQNFGFIVINTRVNRATAMLVEYSREIIWKLVGEWIAPVACGNFGLGLENLHLSSEEIGLL